MSHDLPDNQPPASQIVDGSEAQFRRLLKTLSVGAYTCDCDGLITFYNEHAVVLWGRAPRLNDPVDRFCGSFKLFSADGTPIAHDQCWMALALKNRQEYNGQEIIVERHDGTRLTALAHANPFFDHDGQLLGAVNLLVDISDRKRAEEAQARLASIVESSDDAIVSKTLEGIITSWNLGAERLFGYSAEEAIGSSVTKLIPADKQDEEQEILARLRRGERLEHFETVRVTKDGRRLDISLTTSPIYDDAGRVIGASKVARDITQRKQAEAALVAVKDQLASQLADTRRLHAMSRRLSTTLELEPILQETLRTAVGIERTDLGLLWLCDAEQSHLNIGATLGFDEAFLTLIDRLPPPGGAWGTCFQQQRRVIVEDTETDPVFASYRAAARQAGFRAVHSTPLITRSGRIVGVLSTHFRQPHRPSDREIHLIDLCARQAVDFIENARLYAELREADRRKDEFLATLAHELRNPLAPITNSLEIMALSDDLSPSLEHVRDIMVRQVGHLVRLVDDLLEVSRITRGKIELRKEMVELAAVIRSAVETSRPLIEAAGHQLAISVHSQPMTLEADPVRLAQVISNLLNNAAKYTEAGGQIWLTARPDGKSAVIAIRDTGVGIPESMLRRVFDMFAQVDGTLKRSQGGLGIGLTLAKSLVHLHGGQIEAHSEGTGKGSEFVIRLPLKPKAPQAVPFANAASEKALLPCRRILLVDDTTAAADTLGALLRSMGQRVRTAYGAASALEQAIAEPPDVVISDIGMPNMDGYELARRLRQQPRLASLVLVALTGYGQDSDRQQARAAGFDHHLVKPVSIHDLHGLLASLPPVEAMVSAARTAETR